MYSLWQYLRQRTRDAFLSGIQDALDVVEQGVDPQICIDAARQLKYRLGSVDAEEVDPVGHVEERRESSTPPAITPPAKPAIASSQMAPSSPPNDMTRRLEQAKHQMSAGTAPASRPQQVPPPRKRPRPESAED